MRRAATLLLAAGTVWAASVRCEGGYFDPCFGTGKDDEKLSEGEPSHRSPTVTAIRVSPGCVCSDGRESVEEQEV